LFARPTAGIRRFLTPAAITAAVVVTLLASPARAVLGSVSTDWPAAHVKRGATVAVTGHVSGLELGDGVVLQQKVLGGWRNVSKVRLDSHRDFRLAIPTWWLGTRSYRVVTTSLLDSTTLGTASDTWTVDVVPTYDAPGLESQHTYSTSSYARWNPCETIGYRVNAAQATAGAVGDVKEAFQRLSQATGFRFAYKGTTSGIPSLGSNSWYPTDTDIVVAWAQRAESTLLRAYGDAVAVGAAMTSGGYAQSDGTSVTRIVKGAVVVDSQRIYRGGFGTGKTRGDIVLHELGHAMGLGHTGSAKQIMYPSVTTGPARLGEGDLQGLYKRGARLGCVEPVSYRTNGNPEQKVYAMP
jgi:hypothetical protein